MSVLIQQASSDIYALVSTLGPTGSAGPTGPYALRAIVKGTVSTFANLPTTNLVNGEAFITADTGILWSWTIPNWNNCGVFVGTLGPVGTAGAQGNQGNTGPQGFTGAQGFTGPQGNTGIQGPVGTIGNPGPDGPQGLQGATGDQGPYQSGGSTLLLNPMPLAAQVQVNTTGSPGVWINAFSIGVGGAVSSQNILLLVLNSISVYADNGIGNYEWDVDIGVFGTPSRTAPVTYNTIKYKEWAYQRQTITNIAPSPFNFAIILEKGTDYSATDTGLQVAVRGNANNPYVYFDCIGAFQTPVYGWV